MLPLLHFSSWEVAMNQSAINGISNISATYQQNHISQSPKPIDTKTDSKAAVTHQANDSLQLDSTVAKKNLETVRTIEDMHSRLNQLAKGIRETNEATGKATEVIGEMQSNIQSTIKNYPPFPIDSKERSSQLMQYASLRKQLISLMVPPPPPAAYEKVKHMWSSLFNQNNTIKADAVPELSASSNTAHMEEASQSLGQTSSQLVQISNLVTQALVQP